jgi:AcrR family transcriptional regulator
MPTPLTEAEIDDFRLRLCQEAERQCLQDGVDAVSMRSLAKGLGCSATTPYTYFENKDEIIAEVRAALLNRVCALLEEIAERGLGAAEWARVHTKAFIDFAFKEPHAYRLIYDLDLPNVDKYPTLALANARSVRIRTAYVRQLIAEGYLKGDATSLGYVYFAAVHGLIVLRMTGRPASTRAQFDKTCHEFLKLLTRGTRGSRELMLDLGAEGEGATPKKRKAPPAAHSASKTSPRARLEARRSRGG